MKRSVLSLIIMIASFSIHAQTPDRAGTIVSIKGKEITVKSENPDKPFRIGEKLRLLTGDKSVLLEVTFPLQTSSRCRIISGDSSRLKPGMIVVAGGIAEQSSGDTGNEPGFTLDAMTRSWNSIFSTEPGKPQVTIDRAIYGNFFLSDSSKSLYMIRFREKKHDLDHYDLVYIDGKNPKGLVVTDRTDTLVFGGFISDVFYMYSSKDEKTPYTISAYKNGKPLKIKSSIHAWFVDMSRGKMTASGGGVVSLIDGNGVSHELYRGKEAYCFGYNLFEKRNDIIVFDSATDSNGGGNTGVSDNYYIEFDSSFRVVSKKKILANTGEFSCTQFIEYRYPYAICVIKPDTNGDGRVDTGDNDAVQLISLNIRTGETKKILTDTISLYKITVHPSGLIFLSERKTGTNTVSLKILNPLTGEIRTRMELNDGYIDNYVITDDFRHLIYQKVYDTDGDGQYSTWKDESDLRTITIY